MLNGQDAGRLLRYGDAYPATGETLFSWIDEPEVEIRLIREINLTIPLAMLEMPLFLPSLSLRNCFILEELCNWFCSSSMVGGGFHWQDDRVIELARTCWEKRLPITAAELSKMLIAHGMPNFRQERFEDRFSFAISTLIAAKRRPAIKKLRQEETATECLYNLWKRRT